MKITPNLIQKFIDNRCTADEAGHVASYLKKHPELITTYFEPAWNDAGEENSPTGYDEEMWEIIHAKIVTRNRIIRFLWATAAASMLIVVTWIWLAFPRLKTPSQMLTAKDEKLHWALLSGLSQSAGTFTLRLFEGMVFIKSVLSELNGWKKDMVLLPGNEMKYSVKAWTVAISRFNTLVRPLPRAYHNENMNRNKGMLIFNNTALADVMNTLDAACHSHILYDEKVLAGKYFSAEAGKKDSLSTLLQVIADMNGLRVIKNEDNYGITESR